MKFPNRFKQSAQKLRETKKENPAVKKINEFSLSLVPFEKDPSSLTLVCRVSLWLCPLPFKLLPRENVTVVLQFSALGFRASILPRAAPSQRKEGCLPSRKKEKRERERRGGSRIAERTPARRATRRGKTAEGGKRRKSTSKAAAAASFTADYMAGCVYPSFVPFRVKARLSAGLILLSMLQSEINLSLSTEISPYC